MEEVEGLFDGTTQNSVGLVVVLVDEGFDVWLVGLLEHLGVDLLVDRHGTSRD